MVMDDDNVACGS